MSEIDRWRALLRYRARGGKKGRGQSQSVALLNIWAKYPVVLLHLGGNLSQGLSLVAVRWQRQQH